MSVELHNGDCMSIMAAIPDGSVDCVITDPPYLMHLEGGGMFRHRQRKEELECLCNFGREDILALAGELRRVCRKVNILAFASRNQIRFWYEAFPDIDPTMLVWGKPNAMPLVNNTLKSDLEYILWFRGSGIRCTCNCRTGSRYDILPVNKADKRAYGHPTIKPLNLIKRYISFASQEGDLILDPFMGTGTTGVACVAMGRRFIGMELDAGHYNTAVQRIRQAEVDKASEFDFGG